MRVGVRQRQKETDTERGRESDRQTQIGRQTDRDTDRQRVLYIYFIFYQIS